ncbi:hypothetical protein WJX72_007609 [[Myrmecia] bisecta]|uniref:guanylate cyclase n=1 Tax=[Myrmecia] bisecta TaxID=41462 RepID=A0AAW1PCV7_9CHLO
MTRQMGHTRVPGAAGSWIECLLLCLVLELLSVPAGGVPLRIAVQVVSDRPPPLLTWNATFNEYLAQTLAPYGLEVTLFPATLAELLTLGSNDGFEMGLASANAFTCLEEELSVSPIATVNRFMAGSSAPAQSSYGGVIFTASNRSDINQLTDVRGRIVEASGLGLLGGAMVQWNELLRNGVDIMSDIPQLRFPNSGDVAQVARDVKAGRADVGFALQNKLEVLVAQNSDLQLSDFKVIGQKNFTDFPFPVSTALIPEWPLFAFKRVDREVVLQVLEALDRINATHPAAIAGGYSNWRTQLSYLTMHKLLQNINWLRQDTGKCPHTNAWQDIVQCNLGQYKLGPADMAAACDRGGYSCPAGYDCACQPCRQIPTQPYGIYVTAGDVDPESVPQTVMTPARITNPCNKMQNCATLALGQPMVVKVVDNLFHVQSAASNASRSPGLEFSLGLAPPSMEIWASAPDLVGGVSRFNITPVLGLNFIQLRIQGQQIDGSPFVVNVLLPTCRDPRKVVDLATGCCTCEADYIDQDGSCMIATHGLNPFKIIWPLLAALLLCGLGMLLIAYRHKQITESMWRIKHSDLTWDTPPVVIGEGASGVVTKATYRGSAVAVKTWVRPSQAGHGSGNSAGNSANNSISLPSTDALPSKASPSQSRSSSLPGLRPILRQDLIGARLQQSPEHGKREVAFREGPADMQTARAKSLDFRLRLPFRAHLQPTPSPVPEAASALGDSFSTQGSASNLLSLPDRRGESRLAHLDGDAVVAVNLDCPSFDEKACPSSTMNILEVAMTSRQQLHGLRRKPLVKRFLDRLRWHSVDNSDAPISELPALVRLRHPNITTIMGACVDSSLRYPLLVMEYMDRGSLYDVLHNLTVPLDGSLQIAILKDIASGVRHLHLAKPPVLHADLKSRNILVDTNFRAKVSDFGLARHRNKRTTSTPMWMAPEVIRGESHTTAADVYSFAVVMYEVYSREDPYAGEDAALVMRCVADTQLDPPRRPGLPSGMPAALAELMCQCWHKDPQQRPSITEVHSRILAFERAFNDSEAARKRELRVAAQLLQGRAVEPENFECVTIFFSDIVGFTDISSELTPQEVMNMLNRLYSAFDEITHKHGLFKVETIGDAYLCCGNLPEPQPDHAKRIAYFALEAVQAANSIPVKVGDPEKGTINIRVGLHSGPVVASVVGKMNPRYCLFGDTVNTASRMESNSERNCIHCSGAAAALIGVQAPELGLRSRGIIQIKGKGNMETHWLSQRLCQGLSQELSQGLSRGLSRGPSMGCPRAAVDMHEGVGSPHGVFQSSGPRSYWGRVREELM